MVIGFLSAQRQEAEEYKKGTAWDTFCHEICLQNERRGLERSIGCVAKTCQTRVRNRAFDLERKRSHSAQDDKGEDKRDAHCWCHGNHRLLTCSFAPAV